MGGTNTSLSLYSESFPSGSSSQDQYYRISNS